MRTWKAGDRAALTACSDLLPETARGQIRDLCGWLREAGVDPVHGPELYGSQALERSGSEKAEILNRYYRDRSVRAIFDVSGGNAANELLSRLDFGAVRDDPKPFWGYSDCTVILNAIYAETGNAGVLWQIRNMTGKEGALQRRRFRSWASGESDELFRVRWNFFSGDCMEGILVGGNLRCFLKLAGTPYFPDLTGKLLFLEARSGGPALLASLLAQLEQTGAFRKISGLLLGTFTELERCPENPGILDLLSRCVLPADLPVAVTGEVGHGAGSRALRIGEVCRISGSGA